MKKFVSPYLKKKIEVDKKKYKLEYYNCTDDLMFTYLDMLDDKTRNKLLSDTNIEFTKKEIISPIDISYPKYEDPFPKIPPYNGDVTKGGTWANHTNKFFDPNKDYSSEEDEFNFEEWFDSLDDEQQSRYSQMISEANEILATLIWEKLKSKDKEELFQNDYKRYLNWFDKLDPENIDFYMERLVAGKRLIPKLKPWTPNVNILKSFGINPGQDLDYEFVKNMFENAFIENIDDDLVRATTIDGLLILCSLNKPRLDHLKEEIRRKGDIATCEYRKKVNKAGNIVHTYIFQMNNKQ